MSHQPIYPFPTPIYSQSYQQPQYAGPPPVELSQRTIPISVGDKKQWDHKLCGCGHNCGTCCLAWFCPCVLFGINQEKLTGRGCQWGFFYLCTMIVFYVFTPFIGCLKRGEVRDRYGIRGGSCRDCLAHLFCSPCALAQEANQLERPLAV